jgi:hypothetical protein
MTALTAPRSTAERLGNILELPMAVGTAFQGGLACLDASGFVTKGITSTTLTALGRFEEQATNSGAAGSRNIRVRTGIFRFANSTAGDLIVNADIGKDCFIVDDDQVAKTNGGATRSRAGKIMGVDSLGVWVNFFPGL